VLHPITLETRVVRTPGLISAELDNETILLGLEQAAYFGMEATAQRIWREIERPRRVAEIVASLTAHYAVDESLCAAQTCTFVETLVAEGVAQVVEERSR
jgi:hypothetical protein